jgi:hypothetical protein
VSDEASTGYVGAIETAEPFAKRIYGEAKRRGLDRAQKVIILGNGAARIWNIADERFPCAIQIVELYHACEYYWKVAGAVLGNNPRKMKRRAKKRRKDLCAGDINGVIQAIRKLSPPSLPSRCRYLGNRWGDFWESRSCA